MELQMLDDVSCQLISSKNLLDDSLVCRDEQQLTLYEMSPVQPMLPVLVETTLITTPVAATIIKVQTSNCDGESVTCLPTCPTGHFIHSQLIMPAGTENGCQLTETAVVNRANQATIQLQSAPHIVTIRVPDSSVHHQSSLQFADSLETNLSPLQLTDECDRTLKRVISHERNSGHDKAADNCVQIETTEEVTESVEDSASFLGKAVASSHLLSTNAAQDSSTSHSNNNGNSNNDDLLSCLMCGKHFVSIGRLKSHEKTHTKSRPFKCIDCGKTFTVRYSLICHTRVHTRERPYTCNMCGSRFSQASSLKTHQIYKHTKNFPYLCRHCGRGFISPGQKHEHVIRHHSKSSSKARKGKNVRKKKNRLPEDASVHLSGDSVEQCDESSSFDLSSPMEQVASLDDSLNA